MPYKRKAYTYLQILKIYLRENCPLELDTFYRWVLTLSPVLDF